MASCTTSLSSFLSLISFFTFASASASAIGVCASSASSASSSLTSRRFSIAWRTSLSTSAGRSLRVDSSCSRRPATKPARRLAARPGRLGRCTSGSCQTSMPGAASRMRSRVSSRICAESLASSAVTAETSRVAAMAPDTSPDRPMRRAIADNAPDCAEDATISRRSSSVSNGENCSTGAETISSTSSASCLTRWCGTCTEDFSASERAARMRASSSCANSSNVWIASSRALLASSSGISGSRRATLAARR